MTSSIGTIPQSERDPAKIVYLLRQVASQASGGFFLIPSQTSVTSGTSYTVSSTDDIVLVSNTTATTVALGSISTSRMGRPLTIKDAAGNASTNNITITTSDPIDGSTSSLVIRTNFESVTLNPKSTGGSWFVT